MKNKLYPAGRRFGRLSVIEQISTNGQWRLYKLQCDCGNTVVASSKLLAAHKRSCGCLLNESRSKTGKRNFRDIAGMRSGKLIAVSLSDRLDKRRRGLWIAACDCGKTKLVRSSQIVSKSLASCGCAFGVTIRPAHLRKAANDARKLRRKTDLKFALNTRVRNAICKSLKGNKNGLHWEDLVGYSADELITRLKKTMPTDFSWSDFLSGKLHIDHIIPLAAHNFQTAKDIDFRRAWALTNLQLLPGPDNFAKHDSLSEPFQPSFSWGISNASL